MFELTKKFRFESAHRLVDGYHGKCARLHGHSWNGHICISGETLNKQGMLLDFSELKTILVNIEDFFDHRTLLKIDDPIFKFLEELDSNQVIGFDFNPTSENLAFWIFEKVRERLPAGIKLKYVHIEETCTTSCRYWDPDDIEEDGLRIPASL